MSEVGETVNCPCCGKELEIVPEGDYHEITCDDCNLTIWQHTADEIIRICNKRQAEVDRLKQPEPCERCEGYQEIRERLKNDKQVTKIMLNFCPNCGKSLADTKAGD